MRRELVKFGQLSLGTIFIISLNHRVPFRKLVANNYKACFHSEEVSRLEPDQSVYVECLKK